MGRQLTDFVADADKHKVSLDTLKAGLGGGAVDPMLVTCQCKTYASESPAWSFDVQISPYVASDRELHVGLFFKVMPFQSVVCLQTP